MSLDLKPGDVYAGNIRILDVLGSGSFANVYKVELPSHDIPLALKLTKQPVSGGDEAQRALREITILRRLTNPHVVRTFDCGLRPDGHIYMLMDYLEGAVLDQWHSFEEPLIPAQATVVIHQACLGLAEPHGMGIVHRDVKPENIFIETSGHIRVLDFGLARSWDGSAVIGVNATSAHMVVGTPHYSQPEQVQTRVLSPASDVYSLATILYELLTACSPFHQGKALTEVREEFRQDPVSWIRCHVNSPLVPLNEQPGCEDLPQSLVDAVALAMDKNPENRPADAGAFANILGLILHRDMNVPVAATLRVQRPDASREDRLFLPGSYRIGTGERCDIQLEDDSVLTVHAVIEWSGVPNQPQLRPITGDGSVAVNDEPIHHPVSLQPEDEFRIGNYRLAVAF